MVTMTVCRPLDKTWCQGFPLRTKKLTSFLKRVFEVDERILASHKNVSASVPKDKHRWEEIHIT